MTIDPQYLLYGFLGLLLAVYLAMSAMYQHGFHVGQMVGWREGAEGKMELSEKDLRQIYWLAINGFRRLLLLSERGEGFRDRRQAKEASNALDRLEYELPPDPADPAGDHFHDGSFDRRTDIIDHWPDEPLSPAQQRLKQQRLKEEPEDDESFWTMPEKPDVR